MTTGTLEIELLDSLLDNNPGCEMLLFSYTVSRAGREGIPCGADSVAHVVGTCPLHGSRRLFVCQEHLDDLISGTIACYMDGKCDIRAVYAGES